MRQSAGPRALDEHARILRGLREMILSQQFPPGARLREQDLAETFGVPRSRIRDVLLELAERRLIDREPNVGAVVRRPSLAEIRQILEVREPLEGTAAGLAAGNVPPESWQDLVDLFGRPTEALIEHRDMERYAAHTRQFRARLLDAAGNPVLRDLLTPLYDRISVVMWRLLLATERARDGLEQHRAVLAALRRGDGDGAERARRRQVRSARQAIEQYHRFLL